MGKQRDREEARQLTRAEQRRKDVFDALRERMAAQGYEEHDLTIGLAYANIMAIVVCMPIVIAFEIAYFRRIETLTIALSPPQVPAFLLLLFALIVVHELIHGAVWAVFAPTHWRAVSFGFIVKYLTPYCTCSEPLRRYQYLTGGLMPLVLLGIVPCAVSVYSGSMFLFLIGVFMILGAGGDVMIALKLLRYRSAGRETVFLDHPYRAGLVAFERRTQT